MAYFLLKVDKEGTFQDKRDRMDSANAELMHSLHLSSGGELFMVGTCYGAFMGDNSGGASCYMQWGTGNTPKGQWKNPHRRFDCK
ncbi:hypothetical protein KKF84_17105 [Myxococcota bacterium]|nr:hypothetical protein [Myxococcota bacterium]MBU1537046.1 hypothetical protein [Myxococcota bacterium]